MRRWLILASLLFCAPAAWGAACPTTSLGNGFNCVQTNQVVLGMTGGGGTTTLTLGATVTAGNMVAVFTSENSVSTVTDSSSQSYTNVFNGMLCSFSSRSCSFSYFCNSAAITSVTVNSNAFANINIIVNEYSGVSHSACLDQSSTFTGPQASPWNSSNITTTKAPELLFGLTFTGTSGATITGTSGWTEESNLSDATNNSTMGIVNITEAATGTFDATGTASTGNTNTAIVSFTTTAAGGSKLAGSSTLAGPAVIH